MMNREQFNITNQRKYKIINYIRSSQGCTKADITRALEGIISKKTIDKLVDEMIKEGIIDFKKERENSRNIKLFVKEDNPAVYVPQQLEEIETIFRKLLDKSKPHWDDLTKQRLNALEELNVDLIAELFFKGTVSLMHFVPTMILQLITESITIHARTIWINKIADKDTLNKLFTVVFVKLASLNSDYVKYLTSIQYKHLGTVQFDNSAVNRVYLPLQLMYVSRKIYKAIGMEKDIEEMLDLLWKFSEDIHIFLFPEIRIYKWDSIRSWKNLLEIYENNPRQTAQNYYFAQKQ